MYWLAVSIGLGLATMVSILAWPISILYRQPGLFAVLLVLAPILVVSSSLAVANARIIRAQRFAAFAVGDVASAILSAAVGLVLAFHGAGIWSLVAQQLVFWATKAAWVTWVAGFRPDFAVHFTSARPLVRFSANNLAANIADFAGKNAPVLIVGGMLGPASVARFAMSYQLARVAETVVSDPVNLATFSAVSAAAGGHEAREFVVTALRVLTLVLLPLFCGLALTASLLTPLVLGERWIGTGPALAALAPGALALCLYKFATAVLLGKGRSGRTFRLTLLTGTAISAATLLGVRFGVTWAVIGFSVGALSMAPFYLSSLARSLDVSSWTSAGRRAHEFRRNRRHGGRRASRPLRDRGAFRDCAARSRRHGGRCGLYGNRLSPRRTANPKRHSKAAASTCEANLRAVDVHAAGR